MRCDSDAIEAPCSDGCFTKTLSKTSVHVTQRAHL